MPEEYTLIHATALEFKGCGLLLKGPSGSGKSDLALRLLGLGGQLVADDQVTLSVESGVLYAQAPTPLRGLLEVRGLGILEFKYLKKHPIDYLIDLKPLSEIERYPFSPSKETIMGIQLPVFQLHAFEAAILDKILILSSQKQSKNRVYSGSIKHW